MNFTKVAFENIDGAELKVSYLHNGKDIGSGAFDIADEAKIEILLPRYAGVVSLYLEIFSQDMAPIKKVYADLEYTEDYGIEKYIAAIDTRAIGVGLYYFKLVLDCGAGAVYAHKRQNGAHISHTEPQELFQMSIVDFGARPLSKYRGGVIYHVFVDRFSKGGNILKRSDAVMLDWDNDIPEYPEYPGAHLENNTFFGGTLFGIVEKLDYIKSLGVNLIYLSPVFEAYSNHKYDTADYMKVDSMFGGEEALSLLIEKASERGIGIILDGVFNHTGSDSVYFNKKGKYSSVGAYQSEKSPYYDWYTFRSYPDDYVCWWDIKILPRINPSVSSCSEFIAGDGGVIDKYSKMGVSGFRLDVADELSDEFLEKIKGRLFKNDKQSILYGEVWEDASNKIAYGQRKKYYLGKELDAVMNYPVRTGIIEFIRDHNSQKLAYALYDVTFNAPKRVRDMQMNLLGTHDTERILTVLGADNFSGMTNSQLAVSKLDRTHRALALKRLKVAYTVVATLPGIPAVYYADEVGLEGYKDPFNRRPFPWNNVELDLLEHYRKLGKIRSEYGAYKDGDFKIIALTDDVLIFARTQRGSVLLTVVNNSCGTLKLTFDKPTKALIGEEISRTISVAECTAQIIKTTHSNSFEFQMI